jgi:glutamate/tyrosine decarboxylase-like PLP-dependent enzyme
VSDERELLRRTAEIAADFLESLDERPVFPKAKLDELLETLGGPLPDEPSDPMDVLEAVARDADPGVVASQGGRYFGFVVGGALPAALAADWLAAAWDQNAGLLALGPSALAMENTAGRWVAELLGIPTGASFAIVTSCQMAHMTCLAAARQHVLAEVGWDAAERGIAGSPPIRVLVGAKRHSTIDRALRYLGIGRAQIQAVGADSEGRMLTNELRRSLEQDRDAPTIVCAQAGEVNTGAFDDLGVVADAVEEHGAWLHVDGAFGLWAAASPRHRRLVDGHERADSWGTDAHKWLNVPYDSGLAFCAHPEPHRRAMTAQAEYYVRDADAAREPIDWTPEHSRRARGTALYAALRSLGRSGIADLVERSCARARQFAEGIAAVPGAEVLNEVVLNQVLFRFRDDGTTIRVLADVQASGEAWMSGTTWDGRPAIRLSVSNWRTSEQDVERAVAAFVAALAPVA